MSEPYKNIEVYKYTETVYYNAEGEEVAREDNSDTWWYDTEESNIPLTEEETEDYIN